MVDFWTYFSVVCRYEREEIFYALNVTVKNATLQDSLSQFVKGELLEGDNAYFCEKCGKKVTNRTITIYYHVFVASITTIMNFVANPSGLS